MMMHGRNNGKKLMTVRIVKHAFEIIHLLTGEVRKPLSILFWGSELIGYRKYIYYVPLFTLNIVYGTKARGAEQTTETTNSD